MNRQRQIQGVNRGKAAEPKGSICDADADDVSEVRGQSHRKAGSIAQPLPTNHLRGRRQGFHGNSESRGAERHSEKEAVSLTGQPHLILY